MLLCNINASECGQNSLEKAKMCYLLSNISTLSVKTRSREVTWLPKLLTCQVFCCLGGSFLSSESTEKKEENKVCFFFVQKGRTI